MKYAILFLLAFALAACGGGGGGDTTTTAGPLYPSPIAGSWVNDNNGAVYGNSIAFPNEPGNLNYLYEPPPSNLATAAAITLNYSLTGSGTFWLEDSTDILPATVSIFIWQKGDNLTCSGDYANYRLFTIQKTNLTFGSNQTKSVPLNVSNFGGCYGNDNGTLTAARFAQVLANAFAVGFTFGGQYFNGHGVGMASGAATFTVNSYVVQ